MAEREENRIELCGRLTVVLDGERRERALPGRQGRLLFTYLVINGDRPASRDELIELLWPRKRPADPDETLSALLSKLRRAIDPASLEGRAELTLRLPAGTEIDLASAGETLERAEAALARSEWLPAFEDGRAAAEVAGRGFFSGQEHSWIDERRREVEELRLRALECVAGAGLHLGGPKLASAERAARTIADAAPFNEAGHRLLMETLAARANVAQALQVYDRLRTLLRDELGTSPGAAVKALHERLLTIGDAGIGPVTEPAAAGAEPAGTSAAALEAEGRTAPPWEERKLVTVLLAEVVAASARTHRDPEDARAALSPYQERLRAEIEHFGGTVEDSMGDIVVAVFGAPVAHEDDPERAVRAAFQVREAVAKLSAEDPEGEFGTRVVLSTGEILVASGLDQGRRITSGEAIGAGLRLQAGLPVGEIGVDESTFRATSHAVDYGEPRPLRLDDDSEGARFWPAERVRGKPAAPIEEGTSARFIGREHELALLKGLHDTLIEEGRPRLVTILGEAGVGKTRLTDHLVGTVLGAPAVYTGRCLAYGEGITYWALREILWEAAGILLDDTSEAASAKLRRFVDGLWGRTEASDATRAVFALAVTSGITLADNPLDRMSPESVAEEIGLAWPAVLSALASREPTTIVVEDLHWAEAPLLDMLEQLVSRSTGGLLVIATARTEFAEQRPGWSARPEMTQVGLEPLTEAQSGELIEELLPGVELEVRDKIVSTAEGNPFFVEEIVRHLIDEGVLVRGEGEISETGSRVTLTIPDTIRALLASRLDALPGAEKRCLQQAAVVGRSFWVTTLESMRVNGSVTEQLGSLERKGLVVTRPTSSLPGQREMSFRHALIHDVAYRSIPRQDRSRAHAEVGRWIEDLAGARRDEFIDLLAHHYERAAAPRDADLAWPEGSADREGVRLKAIGALVDAGRAAERRFAIEQALGYANRALVLAASDDERLPALELKARSLHAAVRADEALSSYMESLEIGKRIGDTEAVSRLTAQATLFCSRYAGAFTGRAWEDWLTETVERGLHEAGDSVTFETGALLVGRASLARRFWGPERAGEARRDAERAIEIAESIESPSLLAYATEGLWNLVLNQGFCEAAELAERMLRLRETMTDRVEAHETLVAASLSFARAGRHETAQDMAREATKQATGLSPHRRLHAACAQTASLLETGKLARLLEATDGVVELVREEGRTCPYGALALAGRAGSLFEAAQGDAAGEAATLLASELAEPTGHARGLRYRALEIVRPILGLEATRRGIEGLKGLTGARDTATAIYRMRSELQLWALSGEWEQLEEPLAEAEGMAAGACAPSLAAIADWARGVMLAASGDHEAAAGRAASATAALDACGERYTAARLLVDLLDVLEGPPREKLASEAAVRLRSMGARGSAAQANLAMS